MWISLWVHLASCSTTSTRTTFPEKPYREALDMQQNFNIRGQYDGTWSILCPGQLVLHISHDRHEESDLCPPERTHAEDWCYAREKPAIRTVDWLKSHLGVDDCFDMYRELRTRTSLEISGEGVEELTDLNPLFELTNLKELRLIGTSFRYLQTLKTLKSLEYLEIDEGAWFRSAFFLKSLKNLKEFRLTSRDHWGVSLPDLKGLEDLETVYMHHLNDGLTAFQKSTVQDLQVGQIDHLEGLGDLPSVKSVEVNKCRSSMVPALTNLPELESLQLRWCKIRFMPLIEDVPELTSLDLAYNEIRKLNFLGESSITRLVLKNNQISYVEPVSRLTDLVELDLSNNKEIRNLDPLKDLEDLKKIHLEGTRIYRVWRSNRSRDRYYPLCPADEDVAKPIRDFCRS